MRILVCDDSVVYRSQIKGALSTMSSVDSVDVAANGKIALAKLGEGNFDFLVLDHEMPDMTGLETLREVRKAGFKTRVIFFSSLSEKGGRLALDALQAGADDVLAKPSGADADPLAHLRKELIAHISQFIAPEPVRVARVDSSAALPKPARHDRMDLSIFRPKIIVVASSTGGPPALDKVFTGMPEHLRCPILVVQHMPPVFTQVLANRLQESSGVQVVEAKHGEPIENKIYIAPGDFHMVIEMKEGHPFIRLTKDPQVNSVRPAADLLFQSAAELYGPQCMSYVLTGMGEDGAAGVRQLKQKHAGVMIQNAESCVVFGMPGAVFRDGTFDAIGNLEEINAMIKKQVGVL